MRSQQLKPDRTALYSIVIAMLILSIAPDSLSKELAKNESSVRAKPKAIGVLTVPAVILHERNRAGGGPREILILPDGCGRITNSWFSASATADSRFHFWNDSSRVFTTFDTVPQMKKHLGGTRSSFVRSVRIVSRTRTQGNSEVRAPLKKVGTGIMLGHRITKFRRVLSQSREGRRHEYELWVISDLPSQKNIFNLYKNLFQYDGEFGLPMKEYYILSDGKKTLRRRLLSEVVRVEHVDSDAGKLLPSPGYRRVNDFFSVTVGEDGSELEMLFRCR